MVAPLRSHFRTLSPDWSRRRAHFDVSPPLGTLPSGFAPSGPTLFASAPAPSPESPHVSASPPATFSRHAPGEASGEQRPCALPLHEKWVRCVLISGADKAHEHMLSLMLYTRGNHTEWNGHSCSSVGRRTPPVCLQTRHLLQPEWYTHQDMQPYAEFHLKRLCRLKFTVAAAAPEGSSANRCPTARAVGARAGEGASKR